MKRLFTADIHLSLYQDNVFIKNLPERLYNALTIFIQMANYAMTHDITRFDIAGDLFNDKNIIHTKPFVLMNNLFDKCSKLNFTILNGNHDMDTTGEDQVSILSGLKGNNVECIIKPKVDGNITYIPYSKNLIRDVEEAEPNDILVSHFGLSEAILSSGLSIVSDIRLKNLQKFKLVILGHYHGPQQVQHVWYCGNPYHRDWGDKNQDKRFLVVDTETLQVESIPTEGYTQFKELVLEDRSKTSDLFDQAKKLRSEGHHVRIKNKTEKVFATTFTDMILQEGGIQLIDDTEIDITDRGIGLAMPMEDKLAKYLEIKQIDESLRPGFLEIAKSICTKEIIDDDGTNE